ncbi:MAG: OFA family MFS transporter [Candidatus Hodarchaeota archaeon]
MLEDKQVRSSRRLLVVVGALIIQICLGSIYAWTIFQTALRAGLYGWPSFWTQLPFAAGLASFAGFMILAGRWQDRIGPRKVATLGGILLGAGYLLASLVDMVSAGNSVIGTTWLITTYGIIGGAGIGFAYVCPIAALVKWYPDKKGLITGVAVAGFGAGALVMGYVEEFLLLFSGGLVGTPFLTLGIIYLVLVVMGSQILVNPPTGWTPPGYKPTSDTAEAKGTDFIPSQIIRTAAFWLLWFMFLFAATAGLMTLGNVKSAAIAIDPSAGGYLPVWIFIVPIGSLIVGIMSIFNAAGRIIWGALSDRLGRVITMVTMFVFLTIGMFGFAVLSLGSFSWVVVLGIASLIGFCFGGNFALFPSSTADYFGPKNVGANYGVLFTSYGVAGVVGGLAAGLIVDFTGSYFIAFVLTGALAIIAIVFALLLYRLHRPTK